MKTPADALKVLKTVPAPFRDAFVFLLRHIASDQACEYFGAQRVMVWAADELEGKAPDCGAAGVEVPF